MALEASMKFNCIIYFPVQLGCQGLNTMSETLRAFQRLRRLRKCLVPAMAHLCCPGTTIKKGLGLKHVVNETKSLQPHQTGIIFALHRVSSSNHL